MENNQSDKCRCYFCGKEGIYHENIVDEDYTDWTGHDTVVTACRDIKSCLERGK